jgi:predicted alpha/beta hydrolase family esterase
MKRVFIIHGWEGFPEEGWFPWLKSELEAKGFVVQIPTMPDTAAPKIETWVPFLRQLVGAPDQDTYLVGHSIGCQTVLRYLAGLEGDIKLGGSVLVAGWIHKLLGLYSEDEKEIARPWIETPIDFEKVKSHVKNIVAVFSDDDEFVPLDNIEYFKEKLGAKTILEHNRGHFSQETGIKELPIVLEEILKMAK